LYWFERKGKIMAQDETFCPQCGAKNGKQKDVCWQCGVKLSGASGPQTASEAQSGHSIQATLDNLATKYADSRNFKTIGFIMIVCGLIATLILMFTSPDTEAELLSVRLISVNTSIVILIGAVFLVASKIIDAITIMTKQIEISSKKK